MSADYNSMTDEEFVAAMEANLSPDGQDQVIEQEIHNGIPDNEDTDQSEAEPEVEPDTEPKEEADEPTPDIEEGEIDEEAEEEEEHSQVEEGSEEPTNDPKPDKEEDNEEVIDHKKRFEELEAGISKYIDFYNHRRPHQSLDYKTPYEVYTEGKDEKFDKAS